MVLQRDETLVQAWSQQLQRRVMRLLLQHDTALFRQQFRLFSAASQLPQMPLLQQYDHYIKLQFFSNELLDDILPRIRRQLSLKTTHKRLLEEAPTRGNVDWTRTLARAQQQWPGQPPLQLLTRVRQRDMETPENVLAVAITLQLRQELQLAMNIHFEDEELNSLERQFFSSADERAQRELASSYARQLKEQARHVTIPTLVQQVASSLKPGPSPYRDLIHWWRRFSRVLIGRATTEQALALSSTRSDEKTTAWLYELWIALELIHLLHAEGAVQPQDMTIATDLLQCTFSWQGRRFRLLYNRQLDTSTSYEPTWEHAPASRPDYSIERAEPLVVEYRGENIWREPPVILDAKYYLSGSDPANTHSPIKKMLGDIALLGAHTGALFFPRLPEPKGQQQITRTIRQKAGPYRPAASEQQIHLYHIEPTLPVPQLQQRLRAILDMAAEQLPERAQPVCQGTFLTLDTRNAAGTRPDRRTLLCPKAHIGPGVFDIVNADTDCLRNPRVCHVINQRIDPPTLMEERTPP
ncbi:hypothetical protein KDH_65950 [Dictyobacter sp. S3.2.2.5]|uniref:DUF2357 domain-containing protein n=1 Tax=Dictyobacter halimunensis TaxID=3026934 RepID=A0ABQ6G3V4_9CHLR|nr:hypothetical protein KDH_65950 [Dictyobacter sp. S3.2.2.5]